MKITITADTHQILEERAIGYFDPGERQADGSFVIDVPPDVSTRLRELGADLDSPDSIEAVIRSVTRLSH